MRQTAISGYQRGALHSTSKSNDVGEMGGANPTSFSDIIDSNSTAHTPGIISLSHILSRTVPPLTSKSHKGSSGRISILGGSAKYTGAPYYAAMSALRVGGDLAYVQCAIEASFPIKCYSPELMVEGVYDAGEFDSLAVDWLSNRDGDTGAEHVEEVRGRKPPSDHLSIRNMVKKVTDLMPRMHVLVIGPGLGRCPMVMTAVADIVIEAKKRGLALVLDADALYMLSLEENKELLMSSEAETESTEAESPRSMIILTPNVVEYKRLVDTIGRGSEEELRKSLSGVIIVKKGSIDMIEYWSRSNSVLKKMTCSEEGGLKRSGGIGDILAGTIGTFAAWNTILANTRNQKEEEERVDDLVLACWMACCVTKRATRLAFNKKKRSMTAPDILEEIGSVIDDIASTTIEK